MSRAAAVRTDKGHIANASCGMRSLCDSDIWYSRRVLDFSYLELSLLLMRELSLLSLIWLSFDISYL